MIKFNTISIQNFLSYGNAPIKMNLDVVGTTLIVGEDLDNTSSGTGANGVGKTTWVNALTYALYGKPISNISMDNLINNINKTNMRVEVEFENNGKCITVRRARKEKGNGNYAKVFIRDIGEELEEGKHDKTPDSVSNINDFIITYLGIPYELFIRIVAFTATQSPFLDLSLRQQSDMMEELFNLTQLSIKAEALKITMRDTKQNLEIKIRHNEQLEGEHARHNNLLAGAQKRVVDWDVDASKQLELLTNELNDLEKVPIKEQESLYEKLESENNALIEKAQLQSDVERKITDVSVNIASGKHNISHLSSEATKIQEWREDNNEEIRKLKEVGDELPKEDFLADERLKVEELTNLENELAKNGDEVKTQQILITDNEKIIKKLIAERIHLEDEKCPYCSQKYKDISGRIVECAKEEKECKNIIIDAEKILAITETKNVQLQTEIGKLNNTITLSLIEIIKSENSRSLCVQQLEKLLNIKCPYGDGYALSDVNAKITTLNKEVDAHNVILGEYAEELLIIDEEISLINANVTEYKDALIFDSISILYEVKNKVIATADNINTLNNTINPHIETYDELNTMAIEVIDVDGVDALDNLLTHQNYLIKLLTKKDSFVRKLLLNKNLTFLNQRLGEYLITLGLPHKVLFTQEMTAHISQFGRELDFGNLSSGQKARVNLALSFSFRDVLQKSHDSINVCILDEVLDVGLDTIGVQNAARMLKQKARQDGMALYIISHRDEVSSIFDNKMIVQMEKGFSSII